MQLVKVTSRGQKRVDNLANANEHFKNNSGGSNFVLSQNIINWEPKIYNNSP